MKIHTRKLWRGGNSAESDTPRAGDLGTLFRRSDMDRDNFSEAKRTALGLVPECRNVRGTIHTTNNNNMLRFHTRKRLFKKRIALCVNYLCREYKIQLIKRFDY